MRPQGLVSNARLLLAVVVVATAALHARTIGFGFSYLDDDALILEQQKELTGPGGIWRSFARPYLPPSAAARDHAYYRPLVTASYALDAAFGRSRPAGYHLTNVVIAALAAGLLFRLLLGFGHSTAVALCGALFYAAHPALTETVAWIPGRPDGLLVVFALTAWLLLRRARETGRWRFRIAHLVAWLAALLCKEAALVLPLVYAGHLMVVERRAPRDAVAPWLLVGWAGTLATYLAARALVLPGDLGAGGVTAASWLSGLPVVVTSLGKLFAPADLSVMATRQDSRIWPGVVAAILLALLSFAPGARRRPLLFAIACFVAVLLPGLPAARALVLESRLALPAIGAVLIACEIAERRAVPRAVAFAVIAALAVGSLLYARNFRDRLSFSQAAVRGSPHSALAHRNLGVAYHVAGQTALARQEYQAAVAHDPDEPVAHNNLAVLLMAEGRLPQAELELRAELAINPGYAVAHANLARVLSALGRADEAAREQASAATLAGDGAPAGR